MNGRIVHEWHFVHWMGGKHRQKQSLILMAYVTVEQFKLDWFKIIAHLNMTILIFSVIADLFFFLPSNKGTIFDKCTEHFSFVLSRWTAAFTHLNIKQLPSIKVWDSIWEQIVLLNQIFLLNWLIGSKKPFWIISLIRLIQFLNSQHVPIPNSSHIDAWSALLAVAFWCSRYPFSVIFQYAGSSVVFSCLS